MPSFTSLLPGSTRIKSPNKEANLKAQTTTPVEEMTWAKHVEEITCPVRQARLNDIAERHRNGTWDGIPRGMSLVVDSDGNERLKKNAVNEGAIKSKDIQKSKEIMALLNLGRTKTAINKPSSDDEGLGQAFDDMLNGMEINPKEKAVSPPCSH